jgi:hypothetical protein
VWERVTFNRSAIALAVARCQRSFVARREIVDESSGATREGPDAGALATASEGPDRRPGAGAAADD